MKQLRKGYAMQLNESDLIKTFKFLCQSTYQGVSGVYVFDSSKNGPTLGVTILTHGNEFCGLGVFAYFFDFFVKKKEILKGKVVFVINNLEAANQYVSALSETNQKEKENKKRSARFVCLNMNRLPKNVLEQDPGDCYEKQRVRDLIPVWKSFDYGIDIHTTSSETDALGIVIGDDDHLLSGLPVKSIIRNIDRIQIGKPAISFYGASSSFKGVAIEAGSHENPQSILNGISTVKALLSNLSMIKSPRPSSVMSPNECKEYVAIDSVIFPDKTYRMVKNFSMFEPISAGQLLAKSEDGQEIRAKYDGHALMGRPTLHTETSGEEMLFLSSSAKKLFL